MPDKKWLFLFVLILFLMSCGASEEELNENATKVANRIFTTQTAGAPTITPTFTKTNTPTDTPDVPSTIVAAANETLTAIPTDTVTPSPTSTDTPTRTSTPTDTPDYESTIVAAANETLTAIPTDTVTPSPTPTDTPTRTPDFEATIVAAANETLTAIPTDTATPQPTWTHFPSATPDFQATIEVAAQQTVAALPTGTPVVQAVEPGFETSENITLTLDDLPPGFEQLDAEDIGVTEDLTFGGYEPSSIFVFASIEPLQFIVGIVIPLPTRIDQISFDNDLRDPEAFADILSESIGDNSRVTGQLNGISAIGEIAAGASLLDESAFPPVRMDVLVFRRGEYAVMMFSIYEDGEQPSASIQSVGKTLDQRIIENQ